MELSRVLAGLVVSNDIPARDIQRRSRRSSTRPSPSELHPRSGPALVLLTADEWNRFGELHLQLGSTGSCARTCTLAAT